MPVYKEVDKKYMAVINPKPTELLDCALIGLCGVIRANTVSFFFRNKCLPSFLIGKSVSSRAKVCFCFVFSSD